MNEGIFYRIAVKKQAKKTVSKNLMKCYGIAFIYLIINCALTLLQIPLQDQIPLLEDMVYVSESAYYLLPVALTIVELLILSPVTLGFFEFSMRITEGKEVSVGDLFLWFGEGKRYFKSLLINFEFGVIAFLIALAALILPIAALNYAVYMGWEWAMFLLIPGIVIITFFVTAKILTYYPGMFLLASNPDEKPWKCLKESGKLFKKRKWDLFLFHLSFFGWFFLVAIIGAVASDMVFANYGFLDTAISAMAIPVGIRISATASALIASGLILLYVLPYIFISTAYYIKGVLNPVLFHVPTHAWSMSQAANAEQKGKESHTEEDSPPSLEADAPDEENTPPDKDDEIEK